MSQAGVTGRLPLGTAVGLAGGVYLGPSGEREQQAPRGRGVSAVRPRCCGQRGSRC